MIEELIKVLDAASGEQVEFVKQAEAQLKLWDEEPGFYTSLLVSVLFVSEKGYISKNDQFLLPFLKTFMCTQKLKIFLYQIQFL